jgi:DNA-directed RNA polymerase subunit RPC12/RpoP
VSTITYKCPHCGAPLKFDGDAQNWKCEYCISSFNEKEIRALENKLISEVENPSMAAGENHTHEHSPDDEFTSKARVYSCTSCGAEIVTDDTTAATFCYYCHNPAIIPGQLSEKYKPSRIIPFKLERDKATEAFVKWCKKKPLISKDFTTSSQLEKLSGIYVPFWLFDCKAKGYISAQAKNVRTWRSGDIQYTQTDYFNVSRTAIADFNGVPADGSQKADNKLMEALEPYDYSQMKDFSMAFLSGYFAERYDLSQETVFNSVSNRIQGYAKKLMNNTISGYGSVNVTNCSADIDEANATYVLLPTWMFTYKYKDKTYIFAMNGQTGKITGNLPISKKRLIFRFVAYWAIAFAIMVLGGMLI